MATKADYDRLADELTAIGRPVIVGFEATGNYHRTLAHRLLTAGFELRLISSVALARTREALHNGWDKNDSKDRSEEHKSELQSLMRNSYAVFCLKKKKKDNM